MYGLRTQSMVDDGYGNLVVTGQSTGCAVRGQTLTWLCPEAAPGLGRIVVDFAAADRLILRKASGLDLKVGTILMDC